MIGHASYPFAFFYMAHSLNMYKFCIDHILELRIPCKILAQDVSRRLKAFVMHFESRLRMSTKDDFDSKDSYLIQTDW